ncbi:hypothetical protein GCM10009760_62980 [Kitasatospora kazusensis]|uniref:LysR substrate binding domain-containing protein n=1 Tax=Kitasatospora kazusensis TaxID=407974 RepID=A0ABN1ZLN1_9ACTN
MAERLVSTSPSDGLPARLGVLGQGFLDGLANRLNVEAGLCEVLLYSRHRVMADELATVMDVEAGLALIVPTTSERAIRANSPWFM